MLLDVPICCIPDLCISLHSSVGTPSGFSSIVVPWMRDASMACAIVRLIASGIQSQHVVWVIVTMTESCVVWSAVQVHRTRNNPHCLFALQEETLWYAPLLKHNCLVFSPTYVIHLPTPRFPPQLYHALVARLIMLIAQLNHTGMGWDRRGVAS